MVTDMTSIRILLALLAISLLSGCGLLGGGNSGHTPEKAQRVVSTAYRQIGTAYRPGGASPQKGFDCSGLIYWAYRSNGLRVPRTTTEQAKTGRGVGRDRMRAGDIVVFRSSTSARGLHTGIYTGGDAFIHSPRPGKKVRMENMNNYWKSNLVAVRRVIP